MEAVELLRKYQGRATDGSVLPEPRTAREFAALLGVHESYLSKCFDGSIPVGMKALRGLRRAFPSSIGEVSALVLASLGGVPEDDQQPTEPLAATIPA